MPATRTGRRPNATRARRHRQAALDARGGAALAPELAQALAQFRPHGPAAADWATLRPAVGDILARSRVRGADSFRKHLTHVTHFLRWATERDLPATAETLTREQVEEYARTGMTGSTAKSRADRRARLRRLADQLHPDTAVPAPIPRPPIKPPYTGRELAQICRIARTQPTAAQRRALAACVGLGAGAGLDSTDLRHLRRQHIHPLAQCRTPGHLGHLDPRTGPDGAVLIVHVPGARARSVPVRRGELTDLVLAGLDGLADDQLVLGRDEDRRNIAARAIGDATLLGDAPRIEQSRLRATWLAHLLRGRLPLPTQLRAAGLASARTLVDLLPHLDPPHDPADDLALLAALDLPVGGAA
jgi:hypothetical protein